MALTKNRILWWIGIELLILIVFAIGVVVRVAGDNQSDVDIIVTFAVLGFCLLLLLVTVAVYLRSYENETSKKKNGFVNILDQRKLAMKLKPVHKNFASDCAICLLPKDSTAHNIVQISCSHDYHEKCIKECFQKMDSLQCPKCRQKAEDHPLTATVVTECERKQS